MGWAIYSVWGGGCPHLVDFGTGRLILADINMTLRQDLIDVMKLEHSSSIY